MKFTHTEGEGAAGRRVSVAPHLKPEVTEDGTFEVSQDELEKRGIDPESARERLEDAGHIHGNGETDQPVPEEDDGEETEETSGQDQEPEPASKTELMNLKKDQLVDIAEEVEEVETDQNKEPLAEDLAGEVALEDE